MNFLGMFQPNKGVTVRIYYKNVTKNNLTILSKYMYHRARLVFGIDPVNIQMSEFIMNCKNQRLFTAHFL